MSKQIVISGNRILASGEGCFLTMGGTVICPDTGKIYQNATVATVDELPADFDSVGYEYHAGKFVPCAPFGVGSGNIAVLCPESCKSVKDSGFSIDTFAGMEVLPYSGSGTEVSNATAEFTFKYVEPALVLFQPQAASSGIYGGFVCGTAGTSVCLNKAGGTNYCIRATITGKTVSLSSTSLPETVFNKNGVGYIAIAFGKRVTES